MARAGIWSIQANQTLLSILVEFKLDPLFFSLILELYSNIESVAWVGGFFSELFKIKHSVH